MKKNNKKGFAIAEVLAVTVAIMVIFITVYSNFFPTTAEFERRMDYNDLESLYATYYMRQFFNEKFKDSDFNDRTYNLVYSENSSCNGSINNSKCTEIAKSLEIEEMIITKNNIKDLKDDIENTGLSDGLKKYIKYLPVHLTQTSSSEQYRIILKTKSGYATSLLNYIKPVEPNKPTLTKNLLPVKYDGDKIVVSSVDDLEWYDYNKAIWANAVTINEDARSKYFNSDGDVILSVGSLVDEDDINTMWVWIPRYNYTIFNYNANGNKSVKMQKIEIHFENTTTPEGTIYCNDDTSNGTSEVCYYMDNSLSKPIEIEEGEDTYTYNGSATQVNGATYTHPAFCYGNRNINSETGEVTCDLTSAGANDGTELAGIWVGKYENSLVDNEINILPGKQSYIGQTVVTYFTKVKSMELYNNPYGFTQSASASYSYDNERSNDSIILNDNNDLDTHMMKNSEWGVVSYLTLSDYGLYNEKFTYKPGNSYITLQTVAVNSTIVTGSGGEASSTTNNITGIYDMVGGAIEYIMAAIRTGSNENFQIYYGGASSYWTSNNSKGRTYLSNRRYYDIYITNNVTPNNKIGKLGDGTKETENWFGAQIRTMPLTGNNNPIFTRGGKFTDTSVSILTYNSSSGQTSLGTEEVCSRSVLVINPDGGNL